MSVDVLRWCFVKGGGRKFGGGVRVLQGAGGGAGNLQMANWCRAVVEKCLGDSPVVLS